MPSNKSNSPTKQPSSPLSANEEKQFFPPANGLQQNGAGSPDFWGTEEIDGEEEIEEINSEALKGLQELIATLEKNCQTPFEKESQNTAATDELAPDDELEEVSEANITLLPEQADPILEENFMGQIEQIVKQCYYNPEYFTPPLAPNTELKFYLRELSNFDIFFLGSGGEKIILKIKVNAPLVLNGTLFRPGQQLAVSFLKPNRNSVVQKDRFAFEGERLSRLQKTHPAFPKILKNVRISGTNFQIMEYLPGKTLDKLSPSDLPVVLKTVIQICEVLEILHKQGIIHRDIKPQNIIVLPSGEIKLIDFGLSVDLKNQEEQKKYFGKGDIFGSPYYSSPEQSNGRTAGFSPHNDIYSLGATLYHLLYQHVPFNGPTVLNIMHQHRTAPLSFPPKPQVPRSVQKIIAKAMCRGAKNQGYDKKNDTYSSITAMKADLEKTLTQGNGSPGKFLQKLNPFRFFNHD
jgi:hypothetical protein